MCEITTLHPEQSDEERARLSVMNTVQVMLDYTDRVFEELGLNDQFSEVFDDDA